MNDAAQPPPVPSPPPPSALKKLVLNPGFFKAWRGIWLFTWRGQLTWRRLPMALFGLIALPLLVYLTVQPPQSWAKRSLWVGYLGNQSMMVNNLSRRLSRSGRPLTEEQRTGLLKIFAEEYSQAESNWLANGAQASVSINNAQSDEIKACFTRIEARAKALLDERQFADFKSFENRWLGVVSAQLREPRWNPSAAFDHWLIDLYFFILLPLTCVRACGAVIRDELQANTLGFLTTRPLRRAELAILKYLSQVAWLQMALLAETLALFAAGGLRQLPGLGSLLPLFLLAQVLAVPAWSALGLFFGMVSKRYMALALVYGAVVEMGIGRIPTNINALSLMRHLQNVLAHNGALETLYEWTGGNVALSAGALILATGIFLALAAALFTFREYHHTVEMQK